MHELPEWADVSAMVIAAAFGAQVARVRDIPLFGTLLAGVVVGLGGGIVRDLFLGLEPAAITTWYYIPAVLVAAILGGLVAYRVDMRRLQYVALQSMAVGLLIGIGVQKGLEYGAPIPSVIFLGVVTGVFGGTMADVLSGLRPAIMQEGPWLLSVVVVGSVLFWALTTFAGFWLAVVVTDVVVVSLRVLSVRFGWSSPEFPGQHPHALPASGSGPIDGRSA